MIPGFHPDNPIRQFNETYAELAVRKANDSPCCKSKRGIVLVSSSGIEAVACNAPPEGFSCTGTDFCKKNCNKLCVHAEEAALLDHTGGGDLEMIHVKTVNGELVPSGNPSCWQCSRAIVHAGVKGMWLYHADGWKRYTANEFHRLTLQNCDLMEHPPLWKRLSKVATSLQDSGQCHYRDIATMHEAFNTLRPRRQGEEPAPEDKPILVCNGEGGWEYHYQPEHGWLGKDNYWLPMPRPAPGEEK